MTEENIIYEEGSYWVGRYGRGSKVAFTVWKNGLTHSTSDSSYDQSDLAIARCQYLAKREKEKANGNKIGKS